MKRNGPRMYDAAVAARLFLLARYGASTQQEATSLVREDVASGSM
jgi:hypothetical protein